MQVGDKVNIKPISDPRSKEYFGTAELVEFIANDGPDRQRWWVQFECKPGKLYPRVISPETTVTQ